MTARSMCTSFLFAAACAMTIGCGGSPVAPGTEGSADGPVSTTGATISGTVSGASGPASVSALGAGLGGVKISVEGTALSATTNGSGAFALRDVPPGLVRLRFEGRDASGVVDLADVTTSEAITMAVVVNGSSIEVESQARVTGSEAQLEGKIVSVNYAARTLVVGTTTVSVPEGVEITNGYRQLELTDLIVGARIHVKGTSSGSAMTASRILAQQTGLDKVTLSGIVTELAGACPDARFKFGSTVIAVNRSTSFVQGSCALIKSGLNLQAKGLRRPDGSVLATQVKFNKTGDGDDGDDGTPVEFSGVVSELSGPCPARKFLVSGREVQTTGATAFQTACATLVNGQTVTITGKQTGNGKVIAHVVK